ncbi:MAG: hypothetical protein M3464_11765 [Chloroflexota bacterium]|nr:hypothetical protein [Chloroflexota bacterium]
MDESLASNDTIRQSLRAFGFSPLQQQIIWDYLCLPDPLRRFLDAREALERIGRLIEVANPHADFPRRRKEERLYVPLRLRVLERLSIPALNKASQRAAELLPQEYVQATSAPWSHAAFWQFLEELNADYLLLPITHLGDQFYSYIGILKHVDQRLDLLEATLSATLPFEQAAPGNDVRSLLAESSPVVVPISSSSQTTPVVIAGPRTRRTRLNYGGRPKEKVDCNLFLTIRCGQVQRYSISREESPPVLGEAVKEYCRLTGDTVGIETIRARFKEEREAGIPNRDWNSGPMCPPLVDDEDEF